MKLALQPVELPEVQLTPAGADVTVPVPVPEVEAVSVSGIRLKVAVTP